MGSAGSTSASGSQRRPQADDLPCVDAGEIVGVDFGDASPPAGLPAGTGFKTHSRPARSSAADKSSKSSPKSRSFEQRDEEDQLTDIIDLDTETLEEAATEALKGKQASKRKAKDRMIRVALDRADDVVAIEPQSRRIDAWTNGAGASVQRENSAPASRAYSSSASGSGRADRQKHESLSSSARRRTSPAAVRSSASVSPAPVSPAPVSPSPVPQAEIISSSTSPTSPHFWQPLSPQSAPNSARLGPAQRSDGAASGMSNLLQVPPRERLRALHQKSQSSKSVSIRRLPASAGLPPRDSHRSRSFTSLKAQADRAEAGGNNWDGNAIQAGPAVPPQLQRRGGVSSAESSLVSGVESSASLSTGWMQMEDSEYFDKEERIEHEMSLPTARPDAPTNQTINWLSGDLLGFGAYGEVRMALNTDNGQIVAVKQVALLPAAGSGNARARPRKIIDALEREIAMLQTLSHENIVSYLGTQRTATHLCIFLEYVAGGSISSLLKRFGRFNESLVRHYTRQILLGLLYLHSHQIIHRDVKGANILVSNQGVCKLADFGAAKTLVLRTSDGGDGENDELGLRSLQGTPYWMAPEVIRQTGHGRKADVWSVGCTVIEMCTGRPPFSELKEMDAVLRHIATTDRIPELPDSFSEEGKDFVRLCLERNVSRRPNVLKLLNHPFLQQKSNPTSPPSSGYSSMSHSRSNTVDYDAGTVSRSSHSRVGSSDSLQDASQEPAGQWIDLDPREAAHAFGKTQKVFKGRHSCGMCDERAALRCSGCKRIYYCSSNCQSEHWDVHMHDCWKWTRMSRSASMPVQSGAPSGQTTTGQVNTSATQRQQGSGVQRDVMQPAQPAKRLQPSQVQQQAGSQASGLPPRPRKKTCARCHQAALLRCSGCKVVYYCSQDCQKEHWQAHMRDCWHWSRNLTRSTSVPAMRHAISAPPPVQHKTQQPHQGGAQPPSVHVQLSTVPLQAQRKRGTGSGTAGGSGAANQNMVMAYLQQKSSMVERSAELSLGVNTGSLSTAPPSGASSAVSSPDSGTIGSSKLRLLRRNIKLAQQDVERKAVLLRGTSFASQRSAAPAPHQSGKNTWPRIMNTSISEEDQIIDASAVPPRVVQGKNTWPRQRAPSSDIAILANTSSADVSPSPSVSTLSTPTGGDARITAHRTWPRNSQQMHPADA